MIFNVVYKKSIAPLSVALGAFVFYKFPLLFLLVLLGGLMHLRPGKGVFNYYFVAMLSAFWMAFINLLKVPESDQLNYMEDLAQISNLGLADVFGFISIGASPTEPLFSMYLKVISMLDSSGALLIFTSTVVVYLCTSAVMRNIYASHKMNGGMSIYFCLIFSIFIFVTFSLTGHIIRQYLSYSLFFVGLSLLLLRRSRWSWLAMILSILVHNSAILLFFAALASDVYVKLSRGKRFLPLIFMACIGALMVSHVASDYGFEGAFALEGSIPVALIVIDLFIFASFVVVSKYHVDNVIRARIISFSIIVIMLLGTLYAYPLLFYRYYFLMDFMRIIWAPAVLVVFYKKVRPLAPNLFVLLLSVVLFSYRANAAPWSYSMGFPNIYLAPVPGLVAAYENIYFK